MPLPPPIVVIPVGHSTVVVELRNPVVIFHPEVGLLLDLGEVLARDGPHVSDVEGPTHVARTEDSVVVPRVVVHDVVLDPQVLLPGVGHVDVGLVEVTVRLVLHEVAIRTLGGGPVTVPTVLLPPVGALAVFLRDPVRGPVVEHLTVAPPALHGDGLGVVRSVLVGAEVRAD